MTMKKTLLILTLLATIAGTAAAQSRDGAVQRYTQGSISDSMRVRIEEEVARRGYDKWSTPEYYPYLKKELNDFVPVMLVVNPAIDSIILNIPTITVYGDYRKRFALEGGRGMIYHQYHDLYSSLFSFPEIEQVSVYDCWDDCRNITYLPIIIEEDEFLVRMENAIFKREWYRPDQDYYHLIGRDRLADKSSYNDDGDFLSGVMEAMIGEIINRR
jgi:hypothetical protein